MSFKRSRLLQILKNNICVSFFCGYSVTYYYNLLRTLKISWNVQSCLKYYKHFSLQYSSGWKKEETFNLLQSMMHTTVQHLIRMMSLLQLPSRLWALNLYRDGYWVKPDAQYLDHPKCGTKYSLAPGGCLCIHTNTSPTLSPSLTRHSVCLLLCHSLAWVSPSTFAHSSSPYTYLFTFELSTCSTELANPHNTVFTTELTVKQSPRLGVLVPLLRAEKATARTSGGVSSCKQSWFCGALRNDWISQSWPGVLSQLLSLKTSHSQLFPFPLNELL